MTVVSALIFTFGVFMFAGLLTELHTKISTKFKHN